MEEKVDQHDEFYEFFNNRPIALLIMVVFGCIVSILEITSNFLIVIIKMRRSSEKTGFDILIVNLAIMFFINGCLLVHFLIDELFYDFTSEEFCKPTLFIKQFSITSIVFSLLALVIVARFFPKISANSAVIIIFVIWIAAVADAIPYSQVPSQFVKLKDGKIRKVCFYPTTYDDFLDWRHHIVFMTVIEFAIPSILFAIASAVGIFCKSSKSNEGSRNMVMHAVIIGSIYIALKAPVRVLQILGYFYYNVSYAYEIMLKLSIHLVGVTNFGLYCYFNKLFYKQTCQFLKVFQNSELIEEVDNLL